MNEGTEPAYAAATLLILSAPSARSLITSGSRSPVAVTLTIELRQRVNAVSQAKRCQRDFILSVAVPFVGAAAGALVVTQAIRLASMKASPVLLHLQLSAPDMPSCAGLVSKPPANLGSIQVSL